MKKVNLKYRGVEVKLNEDTFRNTDYYGKPMTPYFQIGRVEGASIIRQYIKKTFPKVKAWVVSESFSMGNSIDIYLCGSDCKSVSDKIYKDVDNFAQSLREGKFNGMIDMYENNESDPYTDDGIRMNTYCKYITTNNRAKFGTVEWGICELNERENETPEELLYYIDKNKREKFLEAVK